MWEARQIALLPYATRKMIKLWQKFKRWVIGVLIGGTALAAGLGAIETETEFRIATISKIPVSAQFGTKIKSFTWEDENVGENIIIKTDAKDYRGFGGTRVFFQATNASKINQNVNLAFSLGENPKWEVRSIQRFDGNETVFITKTRRETIPTPQGYATTTGNPIPSQLEIDVEYQATTTRDIWTDLSVSSLIDTKGLKRKDLKGKQTKQQATDLILSGQTKYYRADVRYPQGTNNEEFFIEAFGDNGYGHLDPANWNYVVDFESGEGYSVADLNTQNAWTGDVLYDVQNTVVQKGSQAVGISSGADNTITQDTNITDITAGTAVWEMRKDQATAVDGFDLRFYRQDASLALRCRFKGATDDIDCYGGTDTQLRATSLANTWYTFNLQFDATANTATAWIETDSPTTLGMAGTSGQDIESIKLVTDQNSTDVFNVYFDNLSDGATPVAAGINKGYIIIEE